MSESKLIQIIGMLSTELENKHRDKVFEKEVGDGWIKQLRENRDLVAERNGEAQKMGRVLATKNTTIILSTKEIDKLKAANEAHKLELSTIDEICGGVENRAFVKVKILRDDYDKLKAENKEWEESSDEHYKWYEEEKSKASKLNAEKLAYMRIVKEVLTDCTEIVDIEDKYKSYLAGWKAGIKKCK